MELGVNRKGKKSPLTKAKKLKARPKQSSPPKGNPSSKGGTVSKKRAKSANRQPFLQTLAQSNTKLKQNLAAKKSPKIKSVKSVKKRVQHNQTLKPKLSLWFAVYAVTILVGLSTILGTTIAIATSFKTPSSEEATALNQSKANNSSNQNKLQQLLNSSSLGQEIQPLKVELEELAQAYPDLDPKLYLVDLDTKGFVSIRGNNSIASASTIKLPILVAFLQDLDRGTIKLDEQLTMTKELMAGGSGDMQHGQPGTKFSALETASKMIVISDNTATNMLIKRLGGMEVLNQRFLAMGAVHTKLRNPLPDLTGTNTTSAEDLGTLLIKINNGELLSLRSRDRLMHIMGNVENDTLLPQGLESEALIAHKTGNIKSVLGDVGTVDMPNGKRYIASMLIGRPDNSEQAKEFIHKASDMAYQYFKQPQTKSFQIE